VEGDRGHQK